DDHEWVAIDGEFFTMGVTDFAQNAMGDIVFIECPAAGTKIQQGKALGVIESIKSVSDVFAPLSGEVVAVNEEVINSPDLCNQDPYGSWMIRAKITNKSELSSLLDSKQYASVCSSSGH
ncbi:MAG: glycine cleavage system protein GcvH, partial [Oligoflexia bacterium]|nr:glycine cleavage system protein GcvH [Oligoflexia bacterium]